MAKKEETVERISAEMSSIWPMLPVKHIGEIMILILISSEMLSLEAMLQ